MTPILLRLALILAFIVIPPFFVFAAGEGTEAIPQYGLTGILAAAMAGVGWVIKNALTRQLDALERLSRAVLIVAQELVKRPCILKSEEVRALADELLAGHGGKEGPQ